ncbi:MAG TPA: hypothetical protein VGT79_04330 [Xanthomonadaceae bacterium]|nr:hypothetical protein [Xanthomonadaceae bacterium]
MTVLILPIALSACSKDSAFDQAASVDVCGMVDQAAVERIVGPLSGQPQVGPIAYGQGIAGVCTWSFKTAMSTSDSTLQASLSTPGSRIAAQDFDPWSEVNFKELEATIGPRMEVKDLGDKALLFEDQRMRRSEIWIQFGKSYAVIRMTGASSSQLVDFARILARDIAARQASSTASDAAAVNNAPASAGQHVVAAPAPGGTPDAHEIAKDARVKALEADGLAREAEREASEAQANEKEATVVLYTMVYAEECIRTDELVRNICSRMGKVIPDNDKAYCDQLPAQTFQQRTSAAYEAFKQAHAAQIATNAASNASTLDGARQDFERQFGQMRSDPVSMMEFESLARELPGHCSVIEKEWLPKLSQGHQGP